jgi:hypothetical protein
MGHYQFPCHFRAGMLPAADRKAGPGNSFLECLHSKLLRPVLGLGLFDGLPLHITGSILASAFQRFYVVNDIPRTGT